MQLNWCGLSIVVLLAALGCENESSNANAGDAGSGGTSGSGNTSAGQGGEGPSEPAGSAGAPPEDVLGDELADFEGSWDGYGENLKFRDGSSRVRLSVPHAGAGTIEFGDSELPTEIDPDVFPYPELAAETPYPQAAHLLPGFDYDVFITLDDTLHLFVDVNQPYRAFCELQTPVAYESDGETRYACVPPVSTMYDDGKCFTNIEDPMPIDCGKLSLCMGGMCACDEESCTVPEMVDGVFELWLEDEETLVGPGLQAEVRLLRTQ